jgi:hypothetical protein
MCNSIKPAWEIVSEMVQKYKFLHARPIDEARSFIEILRATLYALAVKLSFHYFLAFMQTAGDVRSIFQEPSFGNLIRQTHHFDVAIAGINGLRLKVAFS